MQVSPLLCATAWTFLSVKHILSDIRVHCILAKILSLPLYAMHIAQYAHCLDRHVAPVTLAFEKRYWRKVS